jgi:hypothetical protein
VEQYGTFISGNVLDEIRAIARSNAVCYVERGLTIRGHFFDFESCKIIDLRRECVCLIFEHRVYSAQYFVNTKSPPYSPA